MTASRDGDGTQRMIPRSAAVRPTDLMTGGSATSAHNDRSRSWSAALDAYERALREGMGRLETDLDERLEAAMISARAAFDAAFR